MPPATVRRIKTGAKAPPAAQRVAPPDMGRPELDGEEPKEVHSEALSPGEVIETVFFLQICIPKQEAAGYFTRKLMQFLHRNQLQNLLESYEGRIRRVIYKKKHLFRRSVNVSLRNIERIIVNSWKTRTEQRQAFYLRYSQQFLDALEEWDGNMQKTKQHESNMAKILELQQKVSQQAIKLRTKRLKELKTLYGNFLQSIKCLKERQIKLAKEQGGFTKEMAILQAENITRAHQQVAIILRCFQPPFCSSYFEERSSQLK